MNRKTILAAGVAMGLGAASAPALGQPAASHEAKPANSRFAILPDSALTPEQRAIVDNVMKIGRAGMNGPGNMLVRSPKVNAAHMQMGEYLRSPEAGLKDTWKELAILVVARFWSSDYEWWVHVPKALKLGIPRDAIEDIKAGRPPRGLDAEQQVIFDLTDGLFRNRGVDDAVYERAKTLLGGEKGLVDMTAFVGMYTASALQLNVTATGLPETPADKLEILR